MNVIGTNIAALRAANATTSAAPIRPPTANIATEQDALAQEIYSVLKNTSFTSGAEVQVVSQFEF